MSQEKTLPSGAALTAFPAFPNGEAVPRVATGMMNECMDLVTVRLQAGSRTFDEMLCCGNLTDLALLQQRWFVQAAQDYSGAMTRLFEHAVALATTALPETGAAPPAEAETPAAPRAAGRTAQPAAPKDHHAEAA